MRSICSSNETITADPTLPTPTIPMLRSNDDNQNAEWTARNAFVASLSYTTAEIFLSSQP